MPAFLQHVLSALPAMIMFFAGAVLVDIDHIKDKKSFRAAFQSLRKWELHKEDTKNMKRGFFHDPHNWLVISMFFSGIGVVSLAFQYYTIGLAFLAFPIGYTLHLKKEGVL